MLSGENSSQPRYHYQIADTKGKIRCFRLPSKTTRTPHTVLFSWFTHVKIEYLGTLCFAIKFQQETPNKQNILYLYVINTTAWFEWQLRHLIDLSAALYYWHPSVSQPAHLVYCLPTVDRLLSSLAIAFSSW